MRFMQSERFQGLVKAILLMGTEMFLYGRIANGTLYYYINQKFAGFTLFAVVGLLAVGLAYQFGKKSAATLAHEHHDPDHHASSDTQSFRRVFKEESPGMPTHTEGFLPVGRNDTSHDHASHSHALSWGGVLLVALPVILGLAVPPRPLGASALDNREMALRVESSALPAAVQAAAKSADERNLLDWWRSFQANTDYNTFANQEAKIVGFVYKDPRYGDDHFLATRFVVSCCVADAAVVGLVVRWPEVATLEDDQWVEVRGKFTPSTLEEWKPPLLIAETVTPVDTPAQPYLYP